MKLFLCVTCNQVFNLSREYKECRGQHGGGVYTDNVNARVWGEIDKVFVLGFDNSTLAQALREQIQYGDLAPVPMRGYGVVSPGREFDAFIIPDSASSVERTEHKPVDITDH